MAITFSVTELELRGTIAVPMKKTQAKLIWNEDYWRDRAEEARTMAAGIRNPECRRIMTELAATYEHLARLTSNFKVAAATPELASDAQAS